MRLSIRSLPGNFCDDIKRRCIHHCAIIRTLGTARLPGRRDRCRLCADDKGVRPNGTRMRADPEPDNTNPRGHGLGTATVDLPAKVALALDRDDLAAQRLGLIQVDRWVARRYRVSETAMNFGQTQNDLQYAARSVNHSRPAFSVILSYRDPNPNSTWPHPVPVRAPPQAVASRKPVRKSFPNLYAFPSSFVNTCSAG